MEKNKDLSDVFEKDKPILKEFCLLISNVVKTMSLSQICEFRKFSTFQEFRLDYYENEQLKNISKNTKNTENISFSQFLYAIYLSANFDSDIGLHEYADLLAEEHNYNFDCIIFHYLNDNFLNIIPEELNKDIISLKLIYLTIEKISKKYFLKYGEYRSYYLCSCGELIETFVEDENQLYVTMPNLDCCPSCGMFCSDMKMIAAQAIDLYRKRFYGIHKYIHTFYQSNE